MVAKVFPLTAGTHSPPMKHSVSVIFTSGDAGNVADMINLNNEHSKENQLDPQIVTDEWPMRVSPGDCSAVFV
jgi:hypothetical protein